MIYHNTYCKILILGTLTAGACKPGARERRAADTPAAAPVVAAPPVAGHFEGDLSADPTAEGRSETSDRVMGTAAWSVELDSLDLRRKATVRIALSAPESTVVVLRAIDTVPPTPGTYELFISGTGISHHDPHTLHGDIHALEVGRRRDYIVGGGDKDRVVIRATSGDTVDAVAGHVHLRGARFADAKPGDPTRDWVFRDVDGDFTAPRASEPGLTFTVSRDLQQTVLEQALNGFGITRIGALNADGEPDSTKSTDAARRFLELRWSAAAIVDSLDVTPTSYFVRLRGRFVPVLCEMSTPDERIVCR